MRVALLAPPWTPVPAPGYGGLDRVIAELAGGLVRRGHDVALLGSPGSRAPSRAVRISGRERARRLGETLPEDDHVERALAVIEVARRRGRPFDVVHDHSGPARGTIVGRVEIPVLHTIHGPLTPDTWDFYREHAEEMWVAVLSRSQLSAAPVVLRDVGVIPHPIDLRAWPLQRRKERYVLWAGRFTPEQGPQRAIAWARAAGRPLVLVGPILPGEEEFFNTAVAPKIDGVHVHHLEEVGGRRKQMLIARAAALLVPSRSPDPFEVAIIESMACGTPVIASGRGGANELVLHGRTGFIVEDESEMAASVGRLAEVDSLDCRAVVASRHDVDAVSSAYEAAYRTLTAAS